jgi:phosphatidylinositol alpha-1,6-mannosyltransferase
MTTPVPSLGIVTNDFPPRPGGIQQYLGSLVAAYPGEVTVLAPRDGPAATPATVVRHPRRFLWPTPGVGDWVASELANAGVDAVLFGAPWPLAAMTDRLRRRLDRPIGVIGHGAEVTFPAAVPAVRSALRASLAMPDICFAVSRYTAARIERLTGRRTHYLGAGVDLDSFRPVAHDPGSPPVVGCVSRFVPRKGQHLLLDAVAELAGEGHHIEVVLAGKGRMEGKLRKRAARLGLPVEFVVEAPWDRLPSIYGMLDVFAMPCVSRWFGLEVEGLGLVFLEAAACGLAVVAGDSGGSPETVVDGETGFVVGNHTGLVDALRKLVTDPGLRNRMGTAGRARAEAELRWDAVVDRLVSGFAAVT